MSGIGMPINQSKIAPIIFTFSIDKADCRSRLRPPCVAQMLATNAPTRNENTIHTDP